MCGIIGAIFNKNVVQTLLNGLKHLEYRGYDSAGMTVIHNERFERLRTTGKISELEKLLQSTPLSGNIGIAHTRWATHGMPSERNAHPHIAGNKIAIVHNGIIENHQILRADLLEKSCVLESETDSELIAHLIFLRIQAGENLISAIRNATRALVGTFALAILYSDEPDHLIAMREGSPLVIGLSEHGNCIASDVLSIIELTNRFIYLEEGDLVEIKKDRVTIFDKNQNIVERQVHVYDQEKQHAHKGDYDHYMLKEIFDQSQTINATLEGRITKKSVLTEAFGLSADEIFSQTKRVQIVACGTSYHAGLVAKYWIEDIAGIPCNVEIASEFRYRKKITEPNTLFVTLSQSGETADTLAALRIAKKDKNYLSTLCICNVPNSSIVRESNLVFMMNAGPEIGVASTKAFTSQLIALFLLNLALGHHHNMNQSLYEELIHDLIELPHVVNKALELNTTIEKISKKFIEVLNALFLARGIEFPIAMEGALKLKEISYIHAEAYPAGELKHGPLALVDAYIPVIALSSDPALLDKMKSNLEEVRARGGKIYLFANEDTHVGTTDNVTHVVMPNVNPYLAPIVYAIPMQLLAYHVALLKGTDVDQPRNLAKSVTVE